jgi:hypothetical protein
MLRLDPSMLNWDCGQRTEYRYVFRARPSLLVVRTRVRTDMADRIFTHRFFTPRLSPQDYAS